MLCVVDFVVVAVLQAKQGELAAAEAGTAAGDAQHLAGAASGKGAAGGTDAGSAVGGARGQDVATLNEPLYCVCHRIGFGDMVRLLCFFSTGVLVYHISFFFFFFALVMSVARVAAR